MSHSLMPVTKVIVRGSSKAPNDALWMFFPYCTPFSHVPSIWLQPEPATAGSPSRWQFREQRHDEGSSPAQAGAPCSGTVSQSPSGHKGVPQAPETQTPLDLSRGSEMVLQHQTSRLPVSPPHPLIPPPSEVELVAKRAAGIVIRCRKLPPFE